MYTVFLEKKELWWGSSSVEPETILKILFTHWFIQELCTGQIVLIYSFLLMLWLQLIQIC